MNNANPYGPRGWEAAKELGVSRRTVYRWINEKRLPYPLTWAALEGVSARPRGPKRNAQSKRYNEGRHAFHPKKTS